MPQEMNMPEELDALGRMLAAVKPSRPALNRDALIYEAGRVTATRAARGKMRLWQGGCALALLSCGLLAAFPREKIVERVVASNPSPAPAIEFTPLVSGDVITSADITTNETLPPDSLLRLRNQVLRQGVGVLRDESGGGGASIPALRPGDGLDALPAWQRRAALATGV